MKDKIFNFYLLAVRVWLGYSMIMGGQSILRFFSSQQLRDFFEHWFGEELGFPAPLFMAFIAKGTEFVGGILVGVGLFTRVSAALLAMVMATATLVANINYSGVDGYIRQDGIVTISCFLFSCLLVQSGSGKFGLDELYLSKRNKLM
ncbi:MAG TPA: DoxX family protein [Cyclobacteriaceae bacterium]|nr:DoxX family protein [Cyclobacteriaceae bacterium]